MDTVKNAGLIALLAFGVVLASWALDPMPADYQGLFPLLVAGVLFIIALVMLVERRRIRFSPTE